MNKIYKTTQNKKKKNNKIIFLARGKSDSIEMMIQSANKFLNYSRRIYLLY